MESPVLSGDTPPVATSSPFVAIEEITRRTVVRVSLPNPDYAESRRWAGTVYERRIAHPVQPTGDREARPSRHAGLIPLKTRASRASSHASSQTPPVIVVGGTGDGCRELQLAGQLVDQLATQGLRVAYMRLTGCDRETRPAPSTDSACYVSDISDYGYPSTRLASAAELEQLVRLQFQEVECACPDLIVATLSGPAWHHDARTVVSAIRKQGGPVTGVLCAVDGSAATLGCETMEALGVEVAAVWTPRADGRVLARDRQIRKADVTLCGRSDLPALSRSVTSQVRRQWLPLDSALLQVPDLDFSFALA